MAHGQDAGVLRRSRFADVISRQLDLFERDEADLIRQCVEAERAYDRADRDEAEERYGDYVDLVETGTEALADLRWTLRGDARRGRGRGVRGGVQPRGQEAAAPLRQRDRPALAGGAAANGARRASTPRGRRRARRRGRRGARADEPPDVSRLTAATCAPASRRAVRWRSALCKSSSTRRVDLEIGRRVLHRLAVAGRPDTPGRSSRRGTSR